MTETSRDTAAPAGDHRLMAAFHRDYRYLWELPPPIPRRTPWLDGVLLIIVLGVALGALVAAVGD